MLSAQIFVGFLRRAGTIKYMNVCSINNAKHNKYLEN
jgi:hypothetical protein